MNLAVAPYRPHGRPVCWVVPLLERPVRRSVDRWLTNGKPLVAPHVKQKHLLHGGIGNPLRVGVRNLDTTSLGPTEHHVADQPQ
jgi:hypothetical protein